MKPESALHFSICLKSKTPTLHVFCLDSASDKFREEFLYLFFIPIISDYFIIFFLYSPTWLGIMYLCMYLLTITLLLRALSQQAPVGVLHATVVRSNCNLPVWLGNASVHQAIKARPISILLVIGQFKLCVRRLLRIRHSGAT